MIAGGESGPRARPMHPDWARSLRDQCQEAGVPFFLKQASWGGKLEHLPALDGRQWRQFPDLDGRTWDEVPGVQQGSVDEEEPTP